MRKSILFTLLLCFLGSTAIYAQKYAFIDTEYILSNINEYTQNQEKIEAKAKVYQEEVQKLSTELQQMYIEVQKNAESMSEEQLKKEQKQLAQKEKEVMELGRKYFGPDGALEDMKSKLLNPFHDKIYEAAKIIAQQLNYAAIIDRATATSIIFADPQYDISNEILSSMGYSK